MNRVESLQDLARRARACRICVDRPLGKPLPHEPRPVFQVSTDAPILIAGQAPGTKVHISGKPFDDRSGDRLRQWLGVGRDAFYDPANFAILPMGFCFPGQDTKGSDLPPRPECAPAWRLEFIDLMPQVRLALTVGQYAQAWHLGGRRQSLTDTVADWRNILAQSDTPQILPLPHPSWRNTGWMKKNPWFERDLLPFLQHRVAGLIGSRLSS